ncbi:cytochrome d ubiquinol oxidase subunit II, partial [Burkholderia sp. SIMBA_045]
GSVIATFSQGVAVGALLDGIPVEGRRFAGSAMDWLAPFPLFCGVGLVVAYALLGCTWLIMKTENELHRKMSALDTPLVIALLVIIGI